MKVDRLDVAARVRFSIGTLMVLVLAATLAASLFVELSRLGEAVGRGVFDRHGSAVLIIAIVLTAIALSAWRGIGVEAMGLQVAICCVLVLIAVKFSQANWWRPLIYWFQGVFALTIVSPLVGRRVASKSWPAWIGWMGEIDFLSGCNLLLVLVGVCLQVALFELVPALS